MPGVSQPQILQAAMLCHARLLERFIELTQGELDRATCAFTRESLGEMLESLRRELHEHRLALNMLPQISQAVA